MNHSEMKTGSNEGHLQICTVCDKHLGTLVSKSGDIQYRITNSMTPDKGSRGKCWDAPAQELQFGSGAQTPGLQFNTLLLFYSNWTHS